MEKVMLDIAIITGRSGSGKSVALRGLEDLGYYCIDNLPISLLGNLLTIAPGRYPKVAVSVDIRNMPTRKHLADLEPIYLRLKHDPKIRLSVVYLDAQDEILLARYSETRRIHPLSHQGLTLNEAIRDESRVLSALNAFADLRIDTSALSVHELSLKIASLVKGCRENQLVIVVQSFGFKNGLVNDADFVFDTRFLPNPFWDPKLRRFNGLERPIRDFFAQHPEVDAYAQSVGDLILGVLPQIEHSHRSYLTIAVGCTGGFHRSVYIAQQLGERLRDTGRLVQIRHNNLDRNQHS